jgi:hypothetical protein
MRSYEREAIGSGGRKDVKTKLRRGESGLGDAIPLPLGRV